MKPWPVINPSALDASVCEQVKRGIVVSLSTSQNYYLFIFWYVSMFSNLPKYKLPTCRTICNNY